MRKDSLKLIFIISSLSSFNVLSCCLPNSYETAKFEDPEKYLIKDGQRPSFRSSEPFEPPPLIIDSLPLLYGKTTRVDITDQWIARYRVGGYLLIHSDAYQEKYCLLLSSERISGFRSRNGHCTVSPYLLFIWIDNLGTVVGGWFMMKNPDRVLLSDDRKEKFYLDASRSTGWTKFLPTQ